MNKSKGKRITFRILEQRAVSIIAVLLVAFLVSGIPIEESQINTKSVALDNSTAKVRNINLNTLGINNPEVITAGSNYWSDGSGSYVYYGNYFQENVMNKTPIKWRVLSMNSDSTGNTSGAPNSMLLMSDNILDNVLFNESFEEYENDLYKKEKDNRTSYFANDYINSNLRYWLNSTKVDGKYMYEDKNGYNYTANGFYDTAFSENEKNAINATTKTESVLDGAKESALINDKVFVLSGAQLDNPLYGFLTGNNYIDNNNSRRLDYTEYVKVNGRYTTYPIWQLRSTVTEQSRKV